MNHSLRQDPQKVCRQSSKVSGQYKMSVQILQLSSLSRSTRAFGAEAVDTRGGVIVEAGPWVVETIRRTPNGYHIFADFVFDSLKAPYRLLVHFE